MKLQNKPRIILQLAILIAVIITVIRVTDPEAYCPLGGLLSFGSRFVNGASSCQMGETQMFLGLALIGGILLLGKLFCSYLCPIGTVTEWLGRWGRKFKIQLNRMPDWLDRVLRIFKYALLLPVLYYTSTSSELFCKTFDPYYAATTGFGRDTVFWWALIAVLVTVLGSLFIRQFWCKYLCPLGALSNLAVFAVFSFGTLIIYLVLYQAGIQISIFYLFILWVMGGFLLELMSMRGFVFPLFKIKRNPDSCTDCKLCDRICPYDINVSQADTVSHIDCTMCADCIFVCPVPDTLTIRKRNWKWAPAFATVLLTALALGFSSRYEFATLSANWGAGVDNPDLSRYETVLKTVKCYGSASSLERKVKRIKGIYGMDAYAKSHRVVLYYDPEEIDSYGIKKDIFTPFKSKIRSLGRNPPAKLEVVYLGVNHLIDNIDNNNFSRLLRQSKYIYGFETNFGEPVRVLVYYDPRKIRPAEIKELIESKEISYKTRSGEKQTVKLNFSADEGPDVLLEIDTQAFLQHIFTPYERKFKEYREYEEKNIRVYEFGMPGVGNLSLRRYLPHLTSHISDTEGILGLETFYPDRPVGWVYYDPVKVDTARIREILTMPQMTVHFRNGEVKQVKNPFTISGKSRVRTVEEVAESKKLVKEKIASILDLFEKKM